jgi:hypothetical protein
MDKKILEIYIEQGMSTYQIAKEENCGQTNVRHWLNKYDLSTKYVRKKTIRPIHICKNCDKTLDHNIRSQRVYCSTNCHQKYMAKERDKRIETAGGLPDNMAIRTLKTYMLKKRGVVCQICELTEWNNKPIPLVLDHINGDSTNSSFENLRLVCGNCDMQLPTYKGKNAGNGRHSRRQRYKDGKSY